MILSSVRLSVRPSRTSFSRPTPLRRVCCCGPGGQEISIDCCTAGARQRMRTLWAVVGSWTQTCLARSVAESRHGRLYICSASVSYLFVVRPIISKSTGPIFAKFSGLVVINLKLVFRSLQGRYHDNQFLLLLGRRLVAQLRGQIPALPCI